MVWTTAFRLVAHGKGGVMDLLSPSAGPGLELRRVRAAGVGEEGEGELPGGGGSEEECAGTERASRRIVDSDGGVGGTNTGTGTGTG